jgi:hypothetical protein
MWVAIEGDQSWSIMQVGMGRTTNTETMGWWRAWGRDHASPGCIAYSDVFPGATRISDWSGISAYYDVRWNYDSQWEFQIGGITRYSLPHSSICWDGKYADWFTETVNSPNSAMGGTAANPLNVTLVRYRSTQGTIWYKPNWNTSLDCTIVNPSPPPYYCDKYASDALMYWSEF